MSDPEPKVEVQQVEDDPSLLDLMLADNQAAPTIYQPTNFWSVYAAKFLPELRTMGLHDFRRRPNSVLQSFGAAEPARMPPLKKRPFNLLPRSVHKRIQNGVGSSAWYRAKRRQVLGYHVEMAENFGRRREARSIRDTTCFRVGNPSDFVSRNGSIYTQQHIDSYLKYAWANQFIRFEKVETYAELGSGLGLQALVLAQLFPKLTLFLYDLPLQLYVCEQYLKKCMPGRVVSYRDTRAFDRLDAVQPGKIYVMGCRQAPLLKTREVDVFWNSASFQEMEPDVAGNYIDIINGRARAIFLREFVHGHIRAPKPGEVGVLQKTTYGHYINWLAGHYTVQAIEPSIDCEMKLKPDGYIDSVWTRRS